MLIETIKKRVIEAMKAGRTAERDLLRVALGDLQTEAERRGGTLPDEEAHKVLRKMMKSNDEMLAALADSDAERSAGLRTENETLQALLPQTLDEAAVVTLLAPVADAIRAAGNDGQATGIAMKHLKSQTDAAVEGKTVAAAVKTMRA